MNNEDQTIAEIKPGRDYTFEEIVIDEVRHFRSGDMLFFEKDFKEKSWETFNSFLDGSPSFIARHNIDQPGGPSWNEFAKFFLREYAWGTETIFNSKQIKIIRLKNRLNKKVISMPVACVLARMIKN
jgi:hypothetical protein